MCLEQTAWTSGPVCSEGERGGEAHIRFLASSSRQQLGGWRIGRWGREMGSLGRASLRKPGGNLESGKVVGRTSLGDRAGHGDSGLQTSFF